MPTISTPAAPSATRRNEYDVAGTVSPSEANELREFTRELKSEVLLWLRENHPTIVP
jgi:hypothetical protein